MSNENMKIENEKEVWWVYKAFSLVLNLKFLKIQNFEILKFQNLKCFEKTLRFENLKSLKLKNFKICKFWKFKEKDLRFENLKFKRFENLKFWKNKKWRNVHNNKIKSNIDIRIN